MSGASRQAAAAARIAASLAVASLLLLGLSACVLDVPYEKYAIVYGVADYQDGVNDLIYPDDDAVDMRTMLVNQEYQVWIKTDSETYVESAAEHASKANLLADIAAVAAVAKEEDLFVFYFSGHGGQSAIGPENGTGDSFDEYIFLYDSDLTPAGLALTFSDNELVDAFADIRARKKVIILDSCNSGGFIGNELEADGEPPSLVEGFESIGELAARAIRLYANFDGSTADIPPWEALVLSASGERESSFESPDDWGNGLPLKNGVFTYYLLEAERKGDLNHDGWVTVTEAFAYTQKKIYEDWNYGDGFPFSPHVSGGPVDYVLFER